MIKNFFLFLSSFIFGVLAAGGIAIAVLATPFQIEMLHAQLGNAGAAYRVAHGFETGQGIEQDLVKARYWYEEAVIRGSKNARLPLALMYAYGLGGPEMTDSAIRIFEQAAVDGNIQAQMNMARHAFLGLGTKKNEISGTQWVTRAAEGGSSEAAALLGTLYIGGIGVKQNLKKAIRWLEEAKDAEADMLVNFVKEQMRLIEELPEDNRAAGQEEILQTLRTDFRKSFEKIIKEDKKEEILLQDSAAAPESK